MLLGMGCYVGPSGEITMTCSPTPHIEGNPAPEATAGHPYRAHFTGGYVCGMSSCFSLVPVSLPSGAEIDPYGRTVVWTPSASQAGAKHVLRVRTPYDSCGDSATYNWTVTVLPAPTITRFEAAATTVPPGGTTTLTAVFANGTGRIDLWTGGTLGTVQSGVPVTTPPLVVTTTYELIVLNHLGHGTTQTLTVQVQ
jgi:hypothetical protein